MREVVEQVRVAFRYEWDTWPRGEGSFDSILAERREFRVGDRLVRERIYPVHLAFVRAGDRVLPIVPGDINNLKPPSQKVLDQYVWDLEVLAADGVTSIVWEHGMNCYPVVAAHLKRLFRLAILTFGDDCPGSSEIKTFPIAKHFDALIYNMFIWNGATGERAKDKYQALGIPYCVFAPNTETAGLENFIRDSAFDVEDKLAALEEGRAESTLVFVGAGFGESRMMIVRGLLNERENLAAEGVTLKLLGSGMPGGLASPFQPPHPRGLGYPIGALYEDAAWGWNTPISSIFNCRLIDLIRMGVLQFICDRYGELREQGFLPEVHYAAYDGTPSGLIARVLAAKIDPKGSAQIARAALVRLKVFKEETKQERIFDGIYEAHAKQLERGR